MCNAVSEAYSLYNDARDVRKGSWTKLPEAVIETNKILTALGTVNSGLGRSVKGGYDYFVKDGHSKAARLGELNTNPIELVMGLIDCHKSKDGNKVKTYTSFLAGFGAKVAVEGAMDSQRGAGVLNKFAKTVSEKTSKIFSVGGNSKEAFVKTGAVLVAGLLYPIISDKVSERVADFAGVAVDKLQAKKGLLADKNSAGVHSNVKPSVKEEHEHLHTHDHVHEHNHEHPHAHDHSHEHNHEHPHAHDHGHEHEHEHSHTHEHAEANLGQVQKFTALLMKNGMKA